MGKSIVCVIILLLLVEMGQSRYLISNSSEFVSNGLDHVRQSPFLMLKGLESTDDCYHMYGFLPCTDNLVGHLFQILVYEYLLSLGEKYVSAGNDSLFKIIGHGGFFGACGFNILCALPGAMIVLVSGISLSKEIAQAQVSTGVGLLAGSTIFLLTILWGTCVIVGKCDFSEGSTSKEPESSTLIASQSRKHRSCLIGQGIKTDDETSYTARIMILSVIPFIIMQLPRIFKLSFGGRIVILTSLIICILLLVGYFIYQDVEPWIQKRRLEYVKHEHLMLDFLKHVERHASRKLLTEQGAPNLPIIKRLFENIDVDEDECLTLSELKKLIMEIKFEKLHSNTEHAITEILEEFDLNHDHKISKAEFIDGFARWLVKSKEEKIKNHDSSKSSLDDSCMERIAIKDATNMPLIFKILNHAKSNASGSLLTKEGRPNIPTIKSLFEKFDLDKDNCISPSELKELIQGVEFGNMDLNRDDILAHLMEKLDANGDQIINEDEFVVGFGKLIDSAISEDDSYLEAWKETDKLVDEKEPKGGIADCISWNGFKSILLILLGTTILSLLAGPLTNAVQNFSTAARIPSFFISFIVLPLATNSRRAISAISAASHKRPRTTSLTFSEIYGGVFMNNILGLSILLALVYARGLTWDFSTEVLVVLIVCTVMGLLASFRSEFPLWTCFIAFLLYPFSLMLVYVLDYVFGWA